MNTIQNRFRKTMVIGSLAIAMLAIPLPAISAEMIPDATVRVNELSGSLANLTSQDFFSIEPAANDSEVTLTLTFGAQSDGRIANNVNFRLFDQAGIDNFKDGVKASESAFGGGSPIFDKTDDYKVSATFTVSGRQGYSVMVYSNATAPADYTLRANNALLVDSSGKNHSPETVATLLTTVAPVAPVTTIAPVAPVVTEIAAIASPNTNRQITAQNAGRGERQYYVVKAISNDEEVTLTFDYTAQNDESLGNDFNFYIFSEETLRQLEAGGRPEIVNLAAGNVVKINENKLRATFRSVGSQIFTVIVANRSQVAATYTLSAEGADFQ